MRWLAAALILLSGASAAWADIRIDISRYENGKTVIAGETAPNQAVILDNKYKTKSDDGGDFKFSVKYKPATCMSNIKSGGDIYSAVIAGCFGGTDDITTPIELQP